MPADTAPRIPPPSTEPYRLVFTELRIHGSIVPVAAGTALAKPIWEMDALEEGGDVSLLVEKWNARDLPRFLALFEGDVTFFELPSGERLGSGEDAVRERYEKVFENADSPRLEVTERMSLPPWTIYRSRPSMDGEGGDDALTIFQTRDNLVRRVWFVRVGPGI